MKPLFLAAALILTTCMVLAAPPYHPYGPNLTYGEVSNGLSVLSDVTNPAAGAVALDRQEGNRYRFGILSAMGLGVEYGAVDDLFDTIDEQARAFQNSGLAILDLADIPGSVNRQVDRLNGVLAEIQDKGYGKAFASMEAPVMPVVVAHRGLGGTLVVDVNASATSKAVGLVEKVEFDAGAFDPFLPVQTIGDVTIDIPSASFKVDNDSTLLTKGAAVIELALGYSRGIWSQEQGDLYAGLRLRYYRVGLTRVATRLGNVRDAQDIFQDIKDAEFNWSEDIGADLGLLWRGERYQVGAALENLNEPEFEYDRLDVSAYLDPAGAIARTLAAREAYVMERRLKLEASLFTEDGKWLFNAALDANAIRDALGDEYQWGSLSAAYAGSGWLIPGLRLGYRANLAGSELSYVTAGLTLFKVWTLDVAMGTETVSIDGTTLPRSLVINTGLEVTL